MFVVTRRRARNSSKATQVRYDELELAGETSHNGAPLEPGLGEPMEKDEGSTLTGSDAVMDSIIGCYPVVLYVDFHPEAP
jgi:hypothetical protein